jgi:hypothetical protein
VEISIAPVASTPIAPSAFILILLLFNEIFAERPSNFVSNERLELPVELLKIFA